MKQQEIYTVVSFGSSEVIMAGLGMVSPSQRALEWDRVMRHLNDYHYRALFIGMSAV